MHILLAVVISAVLFLYPLWIIFRRAGLNPQLAFLVLIPYVGFLLVIVFLGAMQWSIHGSGPGDRSKPDNSGASL